MFIGHFAAAFLLAVAFPQSPVLVILIAVSFPDLLWGILVPLGAEKVRVDPGSPLQRTIQFQSYPYSHSLLLTNAFALVVGLILATILRNPLVAVVFVLGSASHWLLDTIMHLRDLPVLGFTKRDKKVGLGLWRRGGAAFALEFIFYAAVVVAVLPGVFAGWALLSGGVFHLANSNSFFGFTKRNPMGGSSNAYATFAFFGFVLFILLASALI